MVDERHSPLERAEDCSAAQHVSYRFLWRVPLDARDAIADDVIGAESLAGLPVFAFVMAFVWFKISNLITPIRVSRETEIGGLDLPEMGAHGYPDFALNNET
jgi:hypothetical protein